MRGALTDAQTYARILRIPADQSLVLRAYRTNPANDTIAVGDTIALMRQIVMAYKDHPVVVKIISDVVSDLHASAGHTAYVRQPQLSPLDMLGAGLHTKMEILCGCFDWVKTHVRYVQIDESLVSGADKDVLMTPEVLFSMLTPSGDCDEFSILMGAIAVTLRFKTYFVTIKADENMPDKFSHVYIMVEYPEQHSGADQKVYLDATQENAFCGWEYKKYWEKREWMI